MNIQKVRIGDRVKCFNNQYGVIIGGKGTTLTISNGKYEKEIDSVEIYELNNDRFMNTTFIFTNSLFNLSIPEFEEQLNRDLREFDEA